MSRLTCSFDAMRQWASAQEHVGQPRRVKAAMRLAMESPSGAKVNGIIVDLSQDRVRLGKPAVPHVGQILKIHLSRETVPWGLRCVDGMNASGLLNVKAQAPS